jgi:hypothetical protein
LLAVCRPSKFRIKRANNRDFITFFWKRDLVIGEEPARCDQVLFSPNHQFKSQQVKIEHGLSRLDPRLRGDHHAGTRGAPQGMSLGGFAAAPSSHPVLVMPLVSLAHAPVYSVCIQVVKGQNLPGNQPEGPPLRTVRMEHACTAKRSAPPHMRANALGPAN